MLDSAEQGHEEILKMLLESGADTSVVSAVGDNGLHLAAMRYDMFCFRQSWISSWSVHVDPRHARAFLSSLTIALHCYRNHLGVMKRLMQAGVDAEAKGEFQNTPLHVACGSGSVDAVRL